MKYFYKPQLIMLTFIRKGVLLLFSLTILIVFPLCAHNTNSPLVKKENVREDVLSIVGSSVVGGEVILNEEGILATFGNFGVVFQAVVGALEFKLVEDGIDYYYGDDEEDGVVDLDGEPIVISESGLYYANLNIFSGEYTVSKINSLSMIGASLTGDNDGWSIDEGMNELSLGVYRIEHIKLYSGEFKFRANSDWLSGNWGLAADLISLVLGGGNFFVAEGFFNIEIDVLNNTVQIEPIIPQITTLVQTSGSIGSTLNIEGQNFGDDPNEVTVFVGTVPATILGLTSTEIAVEVPEGAVYSQVTVVVGGRSAGSNQFFNPTFSSNGILDVAAFETAEVFSLSHDSYNIHSGDFDGDGLPDVVVLNGNSIMVYRNITTEQGNIQFEATPLQLFAGDTPIGLGVYDLDGDGKPDLVVTNSISNNFVVFKNTGSGSGDIAFEQEFSFNFELILGVGVQGNPTSVAIGDLNMDGLPDLAFVLENQNAFAMFENLGSFDFEHAYIDYAGTGPRYLAISDLNMDNKPEVIISGFESNNLHVVRNTNSTIGEFSFNAPQSFAAGSRVQEVTAGDLDGDGLPDLVAANNSSANISVFRNTSVIGGAINFETKVDFNTGVSNNLSIAISDYDGDGKPDIAASTGINLKIHIFKNYSTSGVIDANSFVLTAELFSIGANNRPIAIKAVDLDLDGRPDLVSANFFGQTFSLFRNRVNPPIPFISTVSSYSGNVGATVTLNGGNFDPVPEKNKVYFGATPSIPLSGDGTSLSIPVPPQSTYEPISVTANSMTTHTPLRFNEPFESSGVLDQGAFLFDAEITTDDQPTGIAFADINMDGYPDKIVAEYGSDHLLIYENIGKDSYDPNNHFAAVPIKIATPARPFKVAVGDIDGDGKIDIAVAYTTANVSVIRNNYSGSGSISAASFDPIVNYSSANASSDVALSDIDGDGKLDLLFLNTGDNQVLVRRNISRTGTIVAGSFDTPVAFDTESTPSSLATADLNADGKPDLVITNNGDIGISVFENNAVPGVINTGSFLTRVNFNIASTVNPWGLALADLDGDGKIDIAYAKAGGTGNGYLAIRKNNNLGGAIDASSFSEPIIWGDLSNEAYTMTAADLDGDDKPELIFTSFNLNKLYVAKNNTTGGAFTSSSFQLNSRDVDGNPFQVAAVDLTGDGKKDLRVTTFNGIAINSYRNVVSAPIPKITDFSPRSAKSGEIVTITGENFSNISADHTVYFGAVKASINSASETALSVTVPLGATYAPISVTVNELTAYSNSPFNPVFVSQFGIDVNSFDSRSDFSTRVVAEESALPRSAAFGDLNGDGVPDLVVTNQNTGVVLVYINQSTVGNFDFQAPIQVYNEPTDRTYDVKLIDLLGRGKPDLAITSIENGKVLIFLNNSTEETVAFSAPTEYIIGTTTTLLEFADLDLDGKPEIIAIASGENKVRIYKNTSSEQVLLFEFVQDLTTGNGISSLAVGDLDGGGFPEILTADETDNTISYFENTSSPGLISFASRSTLAAINGLKSIYLADIENKGAFDIVAANGSDGSVSVYRNKFVGGISFGSRVDYVLPVDNNSDYITVGDVDGDGKVDLITSGSGNSKITVLRNVHIGGDFIAGSFESAVEFNNGGGSTKLLFGDIDGDDRSDIIMVDNPNHAIAIFRNRSAFNTPSNQPSNASYTNTENSISITYEASAGGAAGYVAIRAVGDHLFTPVNGVPLEAGEDLGGEHIVAYIGSELSFTDENLPVGTSFEYRIYAYNGSGQDIRYLTAEEPLALSATTLAENPVGPIEINISGKSANALFVNINPAEPVSLGHIVLVRKGSAVPDGLIEDGQHYTSNSIIEIAEEEDVRVFYTNAFNNANVPGLESSTEYFFKAYAFNGSGQSRNYSLEGFVETNGFTVADPPVELAANLVVSDITSNSLKVQFTKATDESTVAGYLVLHAEVVNEESPVLGQLLNGYEFTEGQSIGDYTVAMNGLGNEVIITNLTPESRQVVIVYTYSGSGNFTNYIPHSSASSRMPVSLAAEPAAQPDNFERSNLSSSGYTFSFDQLFDEPIEGQESLLFLDKENADFISFITAGGAHPFIPVILGGFQENYNIEIRFGSGKQQKAHRFLVPEGATVGVTDANYAYHDYVDVPFEVWDVSRDIQLNVSFRDQGRNGVYDLVELNTSGSPEIQSREYTYISDTEYDPNNPNAEIAVNGGHLFRNMYFFWPYLKAGNTWDAGNLPEGLFRYGHYKLGQNGYLVVRGANQLENVVPEDGRLYKIGDIIGNGEVVHVDYANIFEETGFEPEQTYNYAIFSFSGQGSFSNYKQESPLLGTAASLAIAPVESARDFVLQAVTHNAARLSFTSPTDPVSGYLVIRQENSAPLDMPQSGSAYVTGDPIGNSTVAYVGAETEFVDGGLNELTNYHYKVFTYTGSGITTNYYLDNTIGIDLTTNRKPPMISDFSPKSGSIGTQISISGDGFFADPEKVVVTIGGIRAEVVSYDENQLTITVHEGAVSGEINVLIDGLSAVSKEPFMITYEGGTEINSHSFMLPVAIYQGENDFVYRTIDVDGDRKSDLISVYQDVEMIDVYRNILEFGGEITDGSFESVASIGLGRTKFVEIADFNGDGQQDILLLISSSNPADSKLWFYINTFNENGGTWELLSFSNQIIKFLHLPNLIDIKVSDIDGDGLLDILILDNTSNLYVFKGKRETENITLDHTINLSNAAGSFDVVDLNQDGKPDLVFHNPGSGRFFIIENLSDQLTLDFGVEFLFENGTSAEMLKLADLDGDGFPDVVWSMFGSSEIVIYRNRGQMASLDQNTFGAAVSIDVNESGFKPIALADINGDGKIDIIYRDQVNQGIFILNNASNPGSISGADFGSFFIPSEVSSNSSDFSIVDVNADGRPDILFYRDIVEGGKSVFAMQNMVGVTIPPSSQPTNLLFAGNTPDLLTVSFDAAENAQNYLVLRSKEGYATEMPQDGASYEQGSELGNALVAYVGELTEFEESGIENDGPYYYSVFAFNGAGTDTKYLVDNPLQDAVLMFVIQDFSPKTGVVGTEVTISGLQIGLEGYGQEVYIGEIQMPISALNDHSIVVTVPEGFENNLIEVRSKGVIRQTAEQFVPDITPTDQPTDLVFSDVMTNSLKVAFNPAPNGATGYIAFRKQDGYAEVEPENGLEYEIGDGIGDGFVAYVGVGTEFNDNGLNHNTEYFYSIYAFNGTGSNTMYNGVDPLRGSQVTGEITGLADEPSAQPGNFRITGYSNEQFNVEFNAADPEAAGYIVVRRLGAFPTSDPLDGTVYMQGQSIGNGTVVLVGEGLSFVELDPLPQTDYHYKIYSYNGSEETINYRQQSPLQGTFLTPAEQPQNQPADFTVSELGSNSARITFTPSDAARYLIVRRAGAAPTANPEDFQEYGFGTNIGGGVVVYNQDSNTILDENLNPATVYFYQIFAFNGEGNTVNYLQDNPLEGNLQTLELAGLAEQPTAQPTDFFTANATDSSIEIFFDKPSPLADGYIVLRSSGMSSAFDPADGVVYERDDIIGDATVVSADDLNTITDEGLSPNTEYFYKIYSFNGGEGTINYLQDSPLQGQANTLASKPQGQPTFAGFGRGEVNMDIYFNEAFDNPDGYIALRFENEEDFTVPIAGTPYELGNQISNGTGLGTVVHVGKNSPVEDGGLVPETTYHYHLFAYNGSGDLINYNTQEPLKVTVSTLAAEPENSPTNFSYFEPTETSYQVTYLPASDVAGYIAVRQKENSPEFTNGPYDGLTYSSGHEFGDGSIVAFIGNDVGFAEVDMDIESTYFYKIYSYNGEGDNINYFTSSVLEGVAYTLAPEPTTNPANFQVNNNTPTSFDVSFDEVTAGRADGYLVLRRENSAVDFVPADGNTYELGLVDGQHTVVLVANQNEFSEVDLESGTAYHYAVYAYNGSNEQVNYRQTNPLIGSATTLDITPPVVSAVNFDSPVQAGQSVAVSAQIVSSSALTKIVLKITNPSIGNQDEIPMTSQGGNMYAANIPGGLITNAGLEFSIYAENANGADAETAVFLVRINHSETGLVIPYNAHGAEQANYRIISVPLELSSTANTVNAVFGEQLGPYGDKSKWRMFQYFRTQNVELSGGSGLNAGEGYWLIVREAGTQLVVKGTGVNATADNPFSISLESGWNQIGNPYPFDISWDMIKQFNNISADLKIFDGSFKNGDLKAFSGGFVNVDNAVNLLIPPYMPDNSGARMAENSDEEGKGWEVLFRLKNPEMEYHLGGVGMHTQASDFPDKYDDFSLPRFFKYLEINHKKTLHGYHISKDIVNFTEQYTWEFEIESNLSGQIEISWNSQMLNDDKHHLVLWDPVRSKGVDMKHFNSYQVAAGSPRPMKVIYGDEAYIKAQTALDEIKLYDPYPNPANSQFNLEYYIPQGLDQEEVQIALFDLMGNRVALLYQDKVEYGFHRLNVPIENSANLNNGIYLVRLICSGRSYTKKLTIKN